MLDKEQKELGPPSTPSTEAALRRPRVPEWRVVRWGKLGLVWEWIYESLNIEVEIQCFLNWRCFLNTRVRAFVLSCFGLDNLLEFRIGEEAMVRIS